MEDVIKYFKARGITYHVEDSYLRRQGKTSRSVLRALQSAALGNKVLYMSTTYSASEHARQMAVDAARAIGWNIRNDMRQRRLFILDEVTEREIGQVDFYDTNNGVRGLNFTYGVIDQDS